MTQKNLLLSVTGMSPAVVTETLYGIAQRIKAGKTDAHWPDEIRIITTSEGKEKMIEHLVKGDWLRQVCEAVDMPEINMPDEHILVVPDASGKDVDDARSEEDHEALANFITRTVRDLTSNDNWQIHASIAGGRKTMTFYLGYAMSLFGRHFDQMSHVLVSDRQFEVAGFYFPGQEPEKDRIETQAGVIHPSQAAVILSDIPFIRMRHSLPNILKKSGGNKLDYKKLVRLINAGDNLVDLSLSAHVKRQELIISKGGTELETVRFHNQMHWAFYLQIIRDSQRYSGDRFDYQRPGKDGVDEDDNLYCLTASTLLDLLGVKHEGISYKQDLIKVVDDQVELIGPDSRDIDNVGDLRKSIASFINAKLPSKKEQDKADKDGEYLSIETSAKGKKPLPNGTFDSFIQGIYKTLREKLPDNLAEALKPALRNTGLDVDPDESEVDGAIDDKMKAYLIGVKPDQIKLVKD